MRLPEPGELFEGRYEILGILGEGGFARVFRARDTKMTRDVALKITLVAETSKVQRFLREAAVIAELQDPHTITLYDFGASADGLRYMAFEYVAGLDLGDLLAEDGPLDPATTVHILMQLASSLHEAHARGVLHRDIKPANILIHEYSGDPYRAKLLDFGIALPTAAEAPRLTQTGGVIGTPRYMAPEQLFGNPLSPATDIYSLGLVAYEMLTGSQAVGSDKRDILAHVISETPLRVPESIAPEGLRHVVERMVAREPSARFGSADRVREALRACRPEVLAWRGPTPHETPGPPVMSKPAAAIPVNQEVRAIPIDVVASTTTDERRSSLGVVAGVLALLGVTLVVLTVVVSLPSEPEQHPHVEPVVIPELRREVAPAVAQRDTQPDASTADAGSAAPGCEAMKAWKPGVQQISKYDGLSRETVALWIPPEYEPTRRHGVIIYYHDMDQRPERTLEYMKFADVANLEPYIVIAPQSQHSRTLAWSTREDWEASWRQVDLALNELCVDTARTFVVGHGNGATAAYHSMCSPRVAAVATTSHQLRPDEADLCKPDEPLPYLYIASTDDPWEPLRGGQGCTDLYGVNATVLSQDAQHKLYRARHECTGGSARWRDDAPDSCITWDCASPFVSCTAPGGRVWHGDAPRPWLTCQSGPSRFPHMRTLWQFFSEVGASGPDP